MTTRFDCRHMWPRFFGRPGSKDRDARQRSGTDRISANISHRVESRYWTRVHSFPADQIGQEKVQLLGFRFGGAGGASIGEGCRWVEGPG